MKIIKTYNYGLRFLIQLNISEMLNFYHVVYLLNPHKKLPHCLLPDDIFALLVLFIISDRDENSLHRLKSFQKEKDEQGIYRFSILSEMVDNFKRKWTF